MKFTQVGSFDNLRRAAGAITSSSVSEDASPSQLQTEIDKLIRTGAQRRNNAKDPSIRALRPAEVDWLTTQELNRLNELQLEWSEATREERSPEAARKRVEAKRAERMRLLK